MFQVLLTLLASFAFLAQAADISMQKPSYGGTGCPQGSAQIYLTGNKQAMTLYFNEYEAQAGKTSGKSLDRAACGLVVPVKVPAGYSVSVPRLEFRGSVNVADGTSAEFNAEYFFNSPNSQGTGPKINKVFSSPKKASFIVTKNASSDELEWSPCGEDVNLRVNSSLLVKAVGKKGNVSATIDKARLIYSLQWRKCS